MVDANLLACKRHKIVCMKTKGKLVREWRESLGMDRKELARRVGTSRQNIENLENDEVDQPRYLVRLAKVMGYSVEDLLALRPPPPHKPQVSTTSQITSPAYYEASDNPKVAPTAREPEKNYDNSVAVALLNTRASMGPGLQVPEHDDVVMRMNLNERWLRRNATFSNPDNLSLVTGVGDSMMPTFCDGDVLMVDRGVTDVKVDAVYVLALRDELYIKRLQRRPDGSLLMLSDNRSYEPYQIDNGERDSFRVLGRVVMTWNAKRL